MRVGRGPRQNGRRRRLAQSTCTPRLMIGDGDFPPTGPGMVAKCVLVLLPDQSTRKRAGELLRTSNTGQESGHVQCRVRTTMRERSRRDGKGPKQSIVDKVLSDEAGSTAIRREFQEPADDVSRAWAWVCTGRTRDANVQPTDVYVRPWQSIPLRYEARRGSGELSLLFDWGADINKSRSEQIEAHPTLFGLWRQYFQGFVLLRAGRAPPR